MDEKGNIFNIAKISARKMHTLSDSYPEESENRKNLRKHMLKSEQRKGLVDCIELAKNVKEIAKIAKDFDDDPLLFNALNGTIDLRTCTLREHQKADYLSKISNVKYDACAEAPLWTSFLNLIFAAKADLIAFVKKLMGVCLTGQINEEILMFFYGTGQNGKTTFIETMKMLLGDYFIRAPASMLMAYKHQGIPNDIARLPGARMVVCSEIEDDNRLNESLVKDLTGGDTITARFLHREFFEFKPTHKLLIYGNHKPVVHGTDRGIWRRVLLIPFTVEIPDCIRRPKPEILAEFENELSGILNWALSGLKAYQLSGLQIPLAVKQATAQYRSESDIVGSFIEEQCETSNDFISPVANLYSAFTIWAKNNGELVMSHKKFSSKLIERGFNNQKIGGAYAWRGIKLCS
jgi:putative DNA primase/helicase